MRMCVQVATPLANGRSNGVENVTLKDNALNSVNYKRSRIVTEIRYSVLRYIFMLRLT